MPVMGRVLKERSVQFDQVFTSSARRACTTIELIWRAGLKFPPEWMEPYG
ncbi:MAG: hypothetical protein HQ562_07790 [Candidatus Marinimicrobia bacterium]|nr:hypothetical protein [Candidatus Neomarinimicrobiota bacterium]